MVKCTETESEMVVALVWVKKGLGSYYLMGRVFVWGVKNVLEMDGSDELHT